MDGMSIFQAIQIGSCPCPAPTAVTPLPRYLGNRPLEPRALEVEFFQWKRFYMRKSKFTESQIVAILAEGESGVRSTLGVSQLVRFGKVPAKVQHAIITVEPSGLSDSGS
jgi:hypothetical protein